MKRHGLIGSAVFLGTGVFMACCLTAALADPPTDSCRPGGLWGDGSDGDPNITGYAILIRDMNYHNLTIRPGGTLNTAGHTVRVCGTLTVMLNGTIKDASCGGAGGTAGTRGLGANPNQGSHPGGCPWGPDDCTAGASGGSGQAGCKPGAGHGGKGGGGGGGGGGAWQGIDRVPDADGGDGANGGAGGKGGGYVVIYAYRVDNQGVIHADGTRGADGADAPAGDCTSSNGYENCGADYYQWGSGTIFDPYRDLAGGGGGGGGGGCGGDGGTVEIHYEHALNLDPNHMHANEGAGGSAGDGGTRGGKYYQQNNCYLYYGVLIGSHQDGCAGGSGCSGPYGQGGSAGRGAHTSGDRAGNGSNGQPGAPGAAGYVIPIWHCGGYDPNDFDVLRYTLDLAIEPDPNAPNDPERGWVEGTNTMQVRCEANGLDTFQFCLDGTHFPNPDVWERDPNDPNNWAYRTPEQDWVWVDDEVVCVQLRWSYDANDVLQLRVGYEGTPGQVEHGLFKGGMFFRKHGPQDVRIVATTVEPWYAYLWWPVKNDGHNWNCDKAKADLWFTVSGDLVAVSNGVLDGVDNLGPQKRYRWRTEQETAAYLFSVAATNYYSPDPNTYTYHGMPVLLYVWPETEWGFITKYLKVEQWAAAVDMLGYFGQAERFGEYPFLSEKYGIYQWPEEKGFGAMEHQTISGQPGVWFRRALMNGLFPNVETLTSHELAHSWWGDEITCATWNHVWLNEAWAGYSEALWFENQCARPLIPGNTPLETLQKYMRTFRVKVGLWGDFKSTIYRYDVSDSNDVITTAQYSRGPWVPHMLRHVTDPIYQQPDDPNEPNNLHTPEFYRLLQTYRDRQQPSGCATTDDFQAAAEYVLQQPLDWFFGELNGGDPNQAHGWVYGRGAPAIRYDWWHPLGDPYHVRLLVGQRQWLRCDGEPMFTMPLDLDIKRSGEWTRQRIWINQSDPVDSYVSRTLSVDGPIQQLVLDRDDWVLTHWTVDLIPGGIRDLWGSHLRSVSGAVRIKDESQAVGTTDLSGAGQRAVLWLAKPRYEFGAGLTDLGVLPGDTWSAAWDINHWGQVVGDSGSGSVVHAFVWLPKPDYGMLAGMNPLPGTEDVVCARAVNDSGVVVGYYGADPNDANTHWAALWQYDYGAGEWARTDLPDDPNAIATASEATNINGSGQVVGWTKVGGVKRGALWEYDDANQVWKIQDLGPGEAYAVNEAGLVAGYELDAGQTYAGYWSGGGGRATTFARIAQAGSHAYAINNDGQVVGEQSGEAFIYLPRDAYDLEAGTWLLNQDLDPNVPAWDFTVGWDINDAGQIVGCGYRAGESGSRGFLLDLDAHASVGDMNCDGVVNFADINPFVLALNGCDAYYAAYPNCICFNADCNGDELVNFADINCFVGLLSGSGQ